MSSIRAQPWRWRERRELLLAAARPGERVLDLGCGRGWFARALAEHGCAVVAVDVDPEMVEQVEGARLSEPDLIPLDHGSVDLVWCSEVIEHVADASALLHEVRRVLAADGRLLLTTPAHGWFRRVAIAAVSFDRHFDPRGEHVRFFTRRSLRDTLRAAGLEPTRIVTRWRRSTLVAEAVRS